MAILIAAVVVVLLLVIVVYNTMVSRKNEVKNAFATIDAMMKKRFELIPNLIATIKESTKFETSTLERIVQLRSHTGGNVSAQQLQSIDKETTGALRNLLVQVEAYPDLKSSQNFLQLQNALQDIEDQLAAARRTYNAAVTNYNNAIEMFPTSIAANMMSLHHEELLVTPENERKNVNVAELFKST